MSLLTEIQAAMGKPPTKRLMDLQINEVSLVDNPANPGARILLLKRKGEVTSDTIEDNISMTKNYSADMADLLEKGTDALTVEKGLGPLKKVTAWLKRYSDAETGNDTMVIAKLEPTVPSVSEIDKAIAELAEQIRADEETPHAAYMRAITSNFGKELYGLRDCMVRAGNNADAFAAQRLNVRNVRARGY